MEPILNETSASELQSLHKRYWVQKWGYYPDKIEKVVKKVTFEEFNKQKEQENLEFRNSLKENNK